MERCPQGCDSKPYIHGRYGKQNTPRFKCPQCKKTFSPRTLKPCADLNISTDTIYRILTCLTEGTGIRATAKINDVHPATVLHVLKIAGKRAQQILDRELRNVKASHIAIDECWTFPAKEASESRPEDHPDFGDQWIFLAITEDKLIPSYALGKRDPHTALEFLSDLKERVSTRFQLTSDGWRTYLPMVEYLWGADIDYGMEIKDFGSTVIAGSERYSPSSLKSVERKPISGDPDPDLISTAYAERSILTVRTKMRRLVRLGLGFSRRKVYLAAALSLHLFAYNFLTIHNSIRCTPAQQANITNRIWNWGDLFSYL